ncbi:MAG: 23S rRNA (cytosine1962-C5)-methyltransferase [Sphingobacteriales bacterium]|jgi:23S rRNA (cytosine1962-C5)-methyltransferase
MNLDCTAQIHLKAKKDESIRRFHPWIFSGAIKSIEGDPKSGDLVEVYSNKGGFMGTGHYTDGSIAVRILSFSEPLTRENLIAKFKSAMDYRMDLGLYRENYNTIFRLIHAEGDWLSGLIVDFYHDTFVIQSHSQGWNRLVPMVAEILQEIWPNKLASIYSKPKEKDVESKYLLQNGDAQKWGYENGYKLAVDWETGQKTGFFIDQRVNRQLLGEFAKDKTILNTFCYSGGFTISSLAAGAKEVHSLDSSAGALDLVTQNLQLNGFDSAKHQNIQADAVDYVRDLPTDYDIIVLDPPAFAKHMSARHKAVQGYKRLNGHAIRQIKPGGLIFTFSCSQVVDNNLFNHTITSAALAVGRKVRIVQQLHQPADHPINIYHPESEYLKGLVLQVE